MLNNDREIIISVANSRKAMAWAPQKLYVSEFWERLKTPARGTETITEYLRLPKSKQDDLKDVGGFVAGTLAGNRRKANNVTGRDIITLDLDNIPPGQTQEILKKIDALGCAYAVHSTRKHEESKPRLRAFFPTIRRTSADEYEPLSRKLGSIVGIELCDPTTFEASRLMYWPSCCADSQYVYQWGDKPFLDVDGLLTQYTDWRNVAEWPQVPGTQQAHVKLAAKQGDPLTKQGVVGAFCKNYDIYRAMDTFLPGVYTHCDDPGRYTFTGGSTTGGAVVYDDGNFLYSHHATDPAGGRLVNAFDLVRLHLYSTADDEAKPDTPTINLPSYRAMCELAVSDASVAAIINQERYEKATQDFATAPDENANWMKLLQVSSTTGLPTKTIDNVLIILENDPRLKGKLAFDEFANRGFALGSLPWDERTHKRAWGDPDDAGMLHYLERVYGIQIADKRMYAAMTICAHRNKFNEVRDYLTGLQWDEVRRLDTLLIDYLGAADNVYTRAATRKSLTAAVARVMVPGTKYDYMPIFSGPQGIGKSTFLRLLGRRWYSDSLQTFEGKEASEMIQGVWINELGELNGLSRSETNAVKQFLSRTEDIYREPYGRRTGVYPRRCVFFGTTNDSEFLKDRTGNRRFWPMDVGIQEPAKNIFTEMEDEIDQIWAEAFVYWQMGEPLYLTGEAERISLYEQETHRESNAKEGIIREFVERAIPGNWDKRSLAERRGYWSDEFGRAKVETFARDRICAAEVWCECFNKDISMMRRADTVEINNTLHNLPGWRKDRVGRQYGRPYGYQRGHTREVSRLTYSTINSETFSETFSETLSKSSAEIETTETNKTNKVSAFRPRS